MDEYNKRHPPFDRTKDALSSKWSKLNQECQKYNGIYLRLKNDRRSGEGDVELRDRVDAIFRMEATKRFTSHMAWNFLKDKPKWLHPDPVVIGRRNRRREPVGNPVDVEDDEPVDVDVDDDVNEEPEQPSPNAGMYGPDRLTRPPGKPRKSRKTSSSSAPSDSSKESLHLSIKSTYEEVGEEKKGYYKAKKVETQLRTLSIDMSEEDRRLIAKKKRSVRKQVYEEMDPEDQESD